MEEAGDTEVGEGVEAGEAVIPCCCPRPPPPGTRGISVGLQMRCA